uniref:Alpha-amylase n=1 Tax=Hypothenemus hampei TaxID=57062 RepID=AMY_HYPHA|nr:RecName: Full=Alpha-amylase; AltName: Full=1,4-alpha-D-glucan glucanohydrolase; AltName: Full=AmyHha; Flags: Precursor [Hypothenemus hampei]AHY03307.1 alpha-amylase [Hypothenemus hampei]
MQHLSILLVVLGSSIAFAQHDPHFADGRNTIVHLFGWKWGDIASECENWLRKKGFAGVQISPPSENPIVSGRPWWENYQPVSYDLKNRNGDEDSLSDMIKRCNNVGVRIYADLVVNHMATSIGQGTADHSYDPGSKSYPAVPYSNENFHASCDIDYNDAASIRNCELSGLKDLDQSQDYVRGKIVDYMNHLVSLGVAGFRVDAAKHMWPADLAAIFGSVNDLNTDFFPSGSRAYIYQEVIDTGSDPIDNKDYTGFGSVCEFKYGIQLATCFRGSNPLKYLENWGTGWGLLDGGNTLVFIDNHDTERSSGSYLNYKESRAYKAANAFMLAHPYDGITKIMSSYDFSDNDQSPPSDGDNILSPGFKEDGTCTNGWICQHRWSPIFNMVEFRSVVSGIELTNWWSGGDYQIAFSRGTKGTIAISINDSLDSDVPTGLPDGTYCDVISGSLSNGSCTGKSITVSGGKAHISIASDDREAAVAIHANAKL